MSPPPRREICDDCRFAAHYACTTAWCQCGCDPAAAWRAVLALACDCIPGEGVRCDRCTALAHAAGEGEA